ncbi:MAG: hydrogenase formation protein HypD [Cytophagales bacterium]|nr:hydrogenase formation protein HypD [Cytophagales bacterium]
MKYLDEYRDAGIVKEYLEKIHKLVNRPWSVMEICGGQTHSLVKNGIVDLLPEDVTMVHGPGCPVCVTSAELIDKAVQIALDEDSILCSFGDMLRVPGSSKSLQKAKAEGGDVRIVYSPLDAVNLALDQQDKNVVFFAVGFETTAPVNALSVLQAKKLGLENYLLLVSHVLVPPAMEALLEDEETRIDGFLAAGHVCTVMGTSEYIPVAEKYRIPIVVTGFEPVDLLKGLFSCIQQLEKGTYKLENQYKRVVKAQGNRKARQLIEEVFEISDRSWRGIGVLPNSGYSLREAYKQFNADARFELKSKGGSAGNKCIAGEILKGLKKPVDCPEFRGSCNPENPLGAPMVSSEGACAAYYNYRNV